MHTISTSMHHYLFFLALSIAFTAASVHPCQALSSKHPLANRTFHRLTTFAIDRPSATAVSPDKTSVSFSQTRRAFHCLSDRPVLPVTVYVIDTGCRVSHHQLSERTVAYPAPGSPFDSGNDDHGHGTHVAARIAGRDFGLSPHARIVCIKALSHRNEGSSSDVISAIRLAIRLHSRRAKSSAAVMCISLGVAAAQRYKDLDRAVTRAARFGIISVVAAGNAARDACHFTPARATGAVTVAATHQDGTLANFSNWGSCVTVGAPGVDVWSAVGSADNAYGLSSGTSMAAPFVSGLVSLIQSERGFVSTRYIVDALRSMSEFVEGISVVSVDRFCRWMKPKQASFAHSHIYQEQDI